MKTPCYLLAGLLLVGAASPLSRTLAQEHEPKPEHRPAPPALSPDEAEALEQLHQKLRRLEDERGPAKAAEQVRQQIEKIMHSAERRQAGRNVKMEIKELHRLGRHEEAERLEREWMEQHDRPRDGAPLEDLHRRLHHLRVAIENLHAAEFHEPAESLARQARKMEEEIERHAHPAMEGRREMEEMRASMEKMHHGMRELQEQLHMLKKEMQKR